MIYEDIEAIASKLENRYNLDVWIDKIEQGFNEPCFFIKTIRTSETQLVDNRYERKNSYDISYFYDKSNKDLYIKAHELNDLLEYIELEDGTLIRGVNRNAEIVDGVLHYLVEYNYTVIKQKEKAPYMEDLKHIGGIKNG